jgi:multiple sugar transport system substrate-binding protein
MENHRLRPRKREVSENAKEDDPQMSPMSAVEDGSSPSASICVHLRIAFFSRFRTFALSRSQSVLWLVAFLAIVAINGCDRQPADGRVHVSYWEKWTGFEGDAMREVVNAFNRSQDRITVDLLTVSQVDQKMLLATAGGNPPDVAGLWSYNVFEYADKNALRPLDDFLKRDGIGPEHYIPAYWELCRHRGRVWALPTAPATVALHWNKRLFREAGLDPERPPRTIEELDAFSERLVKRDPVTHKITQMGFMPSEPGWWNWGWGYWFGGKLWDGVSRVTPDAPENVRAFRWVQSYSQRYGAADVQLFQSGFGNFSSPQNAFIAEQVAMVLQGVWMYNFISKYNPKVEWGAAPFPYPADRPDLARSSVVDMDVLVIPTGAQHPQEAWEFAKFVNSQPGMELLCMGQRKHSPLAQVSPAFFARHPNPYIRLFTDLAKSRNTFHPPRIGVWRQYNDEMRAAFDSIWLGTQTPEAALAAVRRRIQPKLDRELDRLRRRGKLYASR